MKNDKKYPSTLNPAQHFMHTKCCSLVIFLLLFMVNSSCNGQSSSGERIIFDSQINSTNYSFELFSISPDGSDLKQHTFDAVPRRANTSGQFSPDGKYVIFGTYKYGGYKVAIAKSDFSGQRKLTKGPHYTYVGSWSPDSEQIVYSKVDTKSAPYFQGDLEVFVMRIDGTRDTNISNTSGADSSPKWSPNGERILFSSDRTGNSDIYSMDVDGENLKNLTHTPDIDEFGPSWSPDSKQIAFYTMKKNRGDQYIDLCIMNTDGGSKRNLTNNHTTKRNVFVPYYDGAPPIFYQTTWSPDGKEIAFSSKRNSENFEIFIISANGKNLRQLTKNGTNNVFPFWYGK
jgi:Tol biopolymer transport system component